jgi:phage tail sheath gpL-like
MSIPLAVSPSQKTPGVYVKVNLLAGAASPGDASLKVALLAPRGTGGNLTPETELRALAGAADASTAFGAGTPGHQWATEVYRRFPTAIVHAAAPSGAAGYAGLTAILSGAPSSANAIEYDIHGVTGEVAWLVGESPATVAGKLADAVAEKEDVLAVAAVATGASGGFYIYSKVGGNPGEDVRVRLKLKAPATSTEGVTGCASHTALTGTTTDPDYTNVLALLSGNEYHLISPCLSNQDVASVSADNNVKRTVNHISAYNEGLNAKLQQYVVGLTTTVAEGIASSVDSNSGSNKEYGEILLFINSRDLPAKLAGAEVGSILRALSFNEAPNRIGELFDTLAGSHDVAADRPTPAESESALTGGVALMSYTDQGIPTLVRPVVTHCQYDNGGQDTRLLDRQNVDATYIVTRAIAAALPAEFPQAKITEDTTPEGEPPPDGVTEIRDVRAFVASILRFFARKGTLSRDRVESAIVDGSLIVRINPSDATQVDFVVPWQIVQPWVKSGLVTQREPS